MPVTVTATHVHMHLTTYPATVKVAHWERIATRSDLRSLAATDAAAISAISAASGSDQIDRAAFNTALSTMVTEINALKTKLNDLLTKLRAF